MTTRQRESVVRYFYDISKGVLIGALVGLATGKLSAGYTLLSIVPAVAFFMTAYTFERGLPDADE